MLPFPNHFHIAFPLAITTVGYGEITPRSFLGRLITIPILVFGLLLITLPSFVLGREFSLVWEKMTRDSVCVPVATLLNPNEVILYQTLEDVNQNSNMGSYTPLQTSRADIRSQSRDLSNRKLAQNQTELSRQIHSLATTIEQQGMLMRKLLRNIDPQEELDDHQA